MRMPPEGDTAAHLGIAFWLVSPLAASCIFHVGSSYGSYNSAPRRREIRSQCAGSSRNLRPAGRQWRIGQRHDAARIPAGFLGNLRRFLRRSIYEGQVSSTQRSGSEGERGGGATLPAYTPKKKNSTRSPPPPGGKRRRGRKPPPPPRGGGVFRARSRSRAL